MKDNWTKFKDDFVSGDHISASWANGIARVLNSLEGTRFRIVRNSNGNWRAVVTEGSANDSLYKTAWGVTAGPSNGDFSTLDIQIGKVYVNGVEIPFDTDYFLGSVSYYATAVTFNDDNTSVNFSKFDGNFDVTMNIDFGANTWQVFAAEPTLNETSFPPNTDTPTKKRIILASCKSTSSPYVWTSIQQRHFGDVRLYI